jgi:hypothetical protein
VLAACWALEVAGNANGVSVDLAQEQIEKSLEVDLDKPVSCQQLVELHEHYGWPSYWTSSPLSLAQVFDIYPGTRAGEAEELKEAEEPHSEPSLRRAREVMRYHVKASDGEIGLVKDLFVDDENWAIRYLLVDTGSWLSRHQVLMASDWIEQVDWSKSCIDVRVPREKVENSPEYEPGRPLEREYEHELHEYYEIPWYWV